MAAGDVKARSNCKKDMQILAAAVANVNPPTLATDGYPVYPVLDFGGADGVNYEGVPAKQHQLCIKGTVTAGQVLVGTFTLWGYLQSAGAWFQIKVNGGSALAETGTDVIGYTEVIQGLSAFDRVAISLASIGGAGASFDAWIVACAEAF